MRLVYTARAYRDLDEIWLYVADDNRRAADRVIARIRQSAETLADHPMLGRVRDSGKTRVLLVSGLPYRIHYRLIEHAGTIEILTIWHTSRLPPAL